MTDTAMDQATQIDLPPYNLLREIDKRCRSIGSELPKVEEVKAQWSGIGYRIGDINLISPLGQIQEILTDPEISPVPGAKQWVRGITNNRGNLLPIIDLSGFLGWGNTSASRRNRVLVIQFGLLTSGLIVNEVRGQRHFLYDDEIAVPENVTEEIQPYVEGAFNKDQETWLLFNMRRLAETPEFLHAEA